MNYLKAAGAFIKAHWFTFVTIGSILYAVDAPYIKAYISTHAGAALIYANIAALVGYYLKSPLTPKP